MKKLLFITTTILISTTISLTLIEIFHFILSKPNNKFYLWPPNKTFVFSPDSSILYGIKGLSFFKTNNDGIRADNLSKKYNFFIATFGGSTTECLYLDQTESWPYLLQLLLNEKNKKYSFWVGNFGKSGLNSFDNLTQLKIIKKTNQFKKFNIFIFLIGINDLLSAIGQNTIIEKTDNSIRKIYFNFPDSIKSIKERLLIYSKLNQIRNKIFIRTQDQKGLLYRKMREWRFYATKIDTLPDIKTGLTIFHKNLKEIVKLVYEINPNAHIIFMTQPVLWNKNLPQFYEKILWMGYTKKGILGINKKYFSSAALYSGMQKYNNKLKKFCSIHNLTLIDLDSMLPKDTSIFYDDCHFNENGSKITATILKNYISNLIIKKRGD